MRTFTIAASILAAGPALAHDGAGAQGSVAAGLAHPFLGLDHLLAMVAVGLIAATQGGVSRWALPGAFVLAMAGGVALGAAGVALPLVEPTILASIIALAVLVAWAARLPAAAGAALMVVFGLAHGAAHGAEAGSADVLPFAVGVLAATVLLHAAGLGVGGLLTRLGRNRLALRLLGAAFGAGALGVALG